MVKELTDNIQKAILLGNFKVFCDKNASSESKQRIRNIYLYSSDPLQTTKNIIWNETGELIENDNLPRLYALISAFINKSNYRKRIPDAIKYSLLYKQKYRCAICGATIDVHSPVDHIVPFKYVGDELNENYQMLCSNCNSKKNASIDYQIRFLLKSI